MKKLILIWFLLGFNSAFAQFNKNSFLFPAKVVNGDTIAEITLQTVEIVGTGVHIWTASEIEQYNRLKRKVIKVYPYASFAKNKLEEINRLSANMNPKEKKQYIKDEERKIKAKFEAQLKQLTFSEGKILIKLIDRETGQSSYQLVKDLRGSLQAFFWQGLARLFGANLKAEYDSEGEDKMIEQIVRGIESGKIPLN